MYKMEEIFNGFPYIIVWYLSCSSIAFLVVRVSSWDVYSTDDQY